MRSDILLFGTGSFAARILFDLCATADQPITIVVAGRRSERLAWLETAGHARASMFQRTVRVRTLAADLASAEAAAAAIARIAPKVVVQAASAQAGSVIAARGSAWAKLVADGGLSATAVFQALLTSRAARGLSMSGIDAHLVNCCYPDVVNQVVAAQGHPISSGIGNVSILSTAFAGLLGPASPPIRVLAHYQTIGMFRRTPAERTGPAPRVWIGADEIADVPAAFARVQLTAEPVIDISGASGVPMLLAMVAGRPWFGHAPGPGGLPGGYPARFDGKTLSLDLPAGLDRDAAIRWNSRFEEENGLAVAAHGWARYTGMLHDKLRAWSPNLAQGFKVQDLESVYAEMHQLRSRLLGILPG